MFFGPKYPRQGAISERRFPKAAVNIAVAEVWGEKRAPRKRGIQYRAFGKRFTLSGSNPARRDPSFQNRTYDAGLGIYDYRNRSFDPATGRFLQRDPVLGGDSLFNPYVFPGNNPVGNVDPMGLNGDEFWAQMAKLDREEEDEAFERGKDRREFDKAMFDKSLRVAPSTASVEKRKMPVLPSPQPAANTGKALQQAAAQSQWWKTKRVLRPTPEATKEFQKLAIALLKRGPMDQQLADALRPLELVSMSGVWTLCPIFAIPIPGVRPGFLPGKATKTKVRVAASRVAVISSGTPMVRYPDKKPLLRKPHKELVTLRCVSFRALIFVPTKVPVPKGKMSITVAGQTYVAKERLQTGSLQSAPPLGGPDPADVAGVYLNMWTGLGVDPDRIRKYLDQAKKATGKPSSIYIHFYYHAWDVGKGSTKKKYDLPGASMSGYPRRGSGRSTNVN
jgi:RHS repeat-associated protein